jgi:streptogramin lyase
VVVQGDTDGNLLGAPFSMSGGFPTGIAVGSDNNMWVAQFAGNNITRIGTGLDG